MNAGGYAIFLILIITLLSPLFQSGYYHDDAINASTPGVLLEMNKNVAEFSWICIKNWIGTGRFFPVSAFWAYSLFTYVPNLILYKSILFFLNAINLFIYYGFVKILTQSAAIALLSALLATISFQFRAYHDPILGYSGLMQMTFLFNIASLLFLHRYLETRKALFYLLSMVFFSLALLNYDIALPFCLLNGILIFTGRNREFRSRVFAAAPFFFLSLAFVLFSLFARWQHNIPWVGGNQPHIPYNPHFDFLTIGGTFIRQCVASFPLSYWFFDPEKIFGQGWNDAIRDFSWDGCVVAAAYFILFFLAGKKIASAPQTKRFVPSRFHWALGLLLWTLPGLLISLSPKYQNEIKWGIGYLPVYISYFGLAMILAFAIVHFGWERSRRFFSARTFVLSIAFLGAVLGTFNYQNNKAVRDQINPFWLHPRTLVEESLKNGLLNGVPADHQIWIATAYPWDASPFLTMHAGKKFQYVGTRYGNHYQYQQDSAGKVEVWGDLNDRQWYLQNARRMNYLYYEAITPSSGYSIQGDIQSLLFTKDRILAAGGDRVKIYLRMGPDWKGNISITGRVLTSDMIASTRVWAGDQFRQIAGGKGWTLGVIAEPGWIIDLVSLRPSFIANEKSHSEFPSELVFLWRKGFSDLELSGKGNWRWSSSEGELVLFNRSAIKKTVYLEMGLSTGFEEESNMSIHGPLFTERLRLNNKERMYRKKIELDPGENLIRFLSDARRVHAPQDPRSLVFRIFNFACREAGEDADLPGKKLFK